MTSSQCYKTFLEEIYIIEISSFAATARIGHFRTDKQCLNIVKLKKHYLNIFVQVQSSEQTLFNFLILVKSRFASKKSFITSTTDAEIKK